MNITFLDAGASMRRGGYSTSKSKTKERSISKDSPSSANRYWSSARAREGKMVNSIAGSKVGNKWYSLSRT